MERNQWRKEYIRLIQNGPQQTDLDTALAAELIDAGYANGIVNSYLDGTQECVWGGPTANGREYADDLADVIAAKSRIGRLKVLLNSTTSYIAGIVSTIAAQQIPQLWQ